MSIQEKQLYESSDVWNQPLMPGQKNLVKAMIDFFPEGITTALDVGCGDGKLTKILIEATKCPVIGLDFSQEALSRCSFETKLGDATNLPFQEDSFDLVLSTDMLEHLSTPMEAIVWNQLFRVSKKWVMLAVPFREELLDGRARCHHCGHHYHVNWHMRAYDVDALVARCPDSFEVDKIIVTGERMSPYHAFETQFRRTILEEWSGWTEAFCPECGGRGAPPDKVKPLSPLTALALGQMIYEARQINPDFRSHSEILVFYRHKKVPLMNQPVFLKALVSETKTNEIVFSEAVIEKNLIPYPSVARVVRSLDEGVILQFPAFEPYDVLRIKAIQSVHVSIEDGLGLLFSGELQMGSDEEQIISLPRRTTPSYHGLLVRIKSPRVVKSVQLGEGLLVQRLMPIAEKGIAYHSAQFKGIPIHLQITAPTYFNGWRAYSFGGADWTDLFKRMEALVEEERLSFQHLMVRIQGLNEALGCERDGLNAQVQHLMGEQEKLQGLHEALGFERDGLNAQVQRLMGEQEKLEGQNLVLTLEQKALHATNHQLLSEVYAFNNRLEVRLVTKLKKMIKSTWRIFKT